MEILDLTDDRLITDKTAVTFAKMPSLERFLVHASGVTSKGVNYINEHSKARAYGFFAEIGNDKDTAAVFQKIGE